MSQSLRSQDGENGITKAEAAKVIEMLSRGERPSKAFLEGLGKTPVIVPDEWSTGNDPPTKDMAAYDSELRSIVEKTSVQTESPVTKLETWNQNKVLSKARHASDKNYLP
ncbi:hypothetical protein CERSUDRAFT_95449 [Gelatoporia subvermispora B]|uniref:Uncharacterized protein n=1 Tax=Ceriporiopsis subvermispora (strain B) TaxID=914234 RepID=M2REC6_CERS8|nr:hypothetical protein CERSUDRAFT_95449 [Gelatoporia subvermispora B]